MRYGINPATGRCRQCGKLQVRYATDRMGHAIEVPAPCLCPKVAPPKPKRVPAWRATVDEARRRARVCQRCDDPVAGKGGVSLYCAEHKREARRESVGKWLAKQPPEAIPWRRYAERNREKLRERARASYQDNPEERQRRNEYKRRWRKANREKVRKQKERAALRAWKKPGPTPTDRSRRYREEVAAGVRKPRRARRNKEGQRLCCNGLCRQVMTGHARMCARCKTALARAAFQPTARAA